MATVRWTVATGVAFPQKSESILAHHFVEANFIMNLIKNNFKAQRSGFEVERRNKDTAEI